MQRSVWMLTGLSLAGCVADFDPHVQHFQCSDESTDCLDKFVCGTLPGAESGGVCLTSERFEALDGHYVVDQWFRRIWQQDLQKLTDVAETSALEKATATCEGATEDGDYSWRVPTIDELRSLVSEDCASVAEFGDCDVSDPECLTTAPECLHPVGDRACGPCETGLEQQCFMDGAFGGCQASGSVISASLATDVDSGDTVGVWRLDFKRGQIKAGNQGFGNQPPGDSWVMCVADIR